MLCDPLISIKSSGPIIFSSFFKVSSRFEKEKKVMFNKPFVARKRGRPSASECALGPRRLTVRTSLFQGLNTGSTLVGVTTFGTDIGNDAFWYWLSLPPTKESQCIFAVPPGSGGAGGGGGGGAQQKCIGFLWWGAKKANTKTHRFRCQFRKW